MPDNPKKKATGDFQAKSSKYDRLNAPDRKITPEAISQAEQHIDSFISSLVSHAETLAQQNKDEVILTPHVDKAVEVTRRGPEKRSELRGLGIFVCSALFGIAIPEFFSELSSLTKQPPAGSATVVIAYFVMALVTLAVSIWLVLQD